MYKRPYVHMDVKKGKAVRGRRKAVGLSLFLKVFSLNYHIYGN